MGDQRRATHLNFGLPNPVGITRLDSILRHFGETYIANWNYEHMQYWDGIVNALYIVSEEVHQHHVQESTSHKYIE